MSNEIRNRLGSQKFELRVNIDDVLKSEFLSAEWVKLEVLNKTYYEGKLVPRKSVSVTKFAPYSAVVS